MLYRLALGLAALFSAVTLPVLGAPQAFADGLGSMDRQGLARDYACPASLACHALSEPGAGLGGSDEVEQGLG